MYNKRSLASDDIADIPDEKRFRHDMVDVFLNNELSSARSARLLHNAAMAGADLQVNQSGSNAQRDLLRKCFRNSKWPSVYEFQCLGGTKPSNVSSNINWPCCCPTNCCMLS